jgi:16S rRNA (guanine1516-N2)-methyltransferase
VFRADFSAVAGVAVICPDPAFSKRAETLATELGLPLVSPVSPTHRATEQEEAQEQYQLLLRVSAKGLELVKPNDPDLSGAVRVEFTSGRSAYRRKQQKKELLLRAVGCKGKATPTIIDGTGGLGRDSFILAAAGCRVRIFERQPIVAALLADGLERAALHLETAEIVRRIQLTAADVVTALEEIRAHGQQIDVVYLDPMFPERRKSALVKKELRMLQLLAGIDSSSEQLLVAAMRIAGKRVVVKRPIKAPFFADRPPSHSLKGKTVRFDVYMSHQ